ncbi:MAG: hypothetical protein A2X25_00290 [Chloroflexi bacterium GWB2_49_20]|nr:MAG: hypothetical protein A2X25_00290 [Chloroflexi bacterium GWB2_49_20]OGN79111.1 MAG: hypothetical protein A2X26_06140 [Chloroflexi bacterium GWC2_49_37]OGN84907.1 MAG: hypothetical protein A2X27_15180 [Chloroflexi bacterium GWD2_49_16]HCC78032.1 hypothetical protein [Anaerolineae bacterium]HCM96616.1 hypothetical protein [Anaerolineae bacterium]
MNQKNADNQEKGQTSETINGSQAPASSEFADASKPQPGRLQRFFRKLLIWLVVLALAFLAGIVTYHYLRYKPLSEAIVDTERLNIEVQAANKKIAALEGEKKALQGEAETATAHLKLLQVLVDVNNARMALFLDDVEAAKAALVNTQDRLKNLIPIITEFDANLAESMPQRLNLIITGLERDTETVKIDLELFTKDLLEIEAALFGD